MGDGVGGLVWVFGAVEFVDGEGGGGGDVEAGGWAELGDDEGLVATVEEIGGEAGGFVAHDECGVFGEGDLGEWGGGV